MSTSNKPASLSQYFEAPEGYVGEFGWVCGYSADSSFMNTALERFTGQAESQRAWEGKVKLVLMLDAGNKQITTSQVPGLIHLPVSKQNRNYRLMHAKVAILQFRKGEEWAVRLVVSTGNWTRQTVEESLDLAWSETVYRKDVESDSVVQLAADIAAASELLNELLKDYSMSLLKINDYIKNTYAAFNEKLNLLTSKGTGTPRFVHTLSESLLSQLPRSIKEHAGSSKRNVITIGSGFYETVNDGSKVPKAISDIVDALQNEGLLTGEPYKEIFVNPDSCQGVANSYQELIDSNFLIYKSIAPESIFGENSSRTLHAKFLLGYNYRIDSSKLNNAWIYLGSGNITNPGFLRRAGSGGNIEAGIIDRLDGCVSNGNEGISITDLLPIQWEETLNDASCLFAGAKMEERKDQFLPCPCEYVNFELNKRVLTFPEYCDDIVLEILDPITNEPLERVNECYLWRNDDVPRDVTILWGSNDNESRIIPVVDSLGRIAATELPELKLADAWLQLSSFPVPPDDLGDTVDSTSEDGLGSKSKNSKFTEEIVDVYPIRKMMETIENIADKQTKLSEADWGLWCERLKQTLIQAKGASIVEQFRSWELNPLSALYEVPFRPCYAEDNSSVNGKLYEGVLNAVSQEWGVINMIGFQGMESSNE
jgi:hypothetical protein